MAGYKPLHIAGYKTGLVQDRVEFILPNDAYPVLENAFIFRERIKRKQGCRLVGRLKRDLELIAQTTTNGTINYTRVLLTPFLGSEPNAQLAIGKTVIYVGRGTPSETIFQDVTPGVLTVTNGGPYAGSGFINYSTSQITIVFINASKPLAGTSVEADYSYYPSLPVMGIRTREIDSINAEQYVFFDTKYAYRYVNDFVEYVPGTTWTGTNYNFFWSTNYWFNPANNEKYFWVTNYSGKLGDPIRYTDGNNWFDFAPVINVAGDTLNQCLCMLPFRSRMVVFNTLEGPTLNTSTFYTNRIRWAQIGNPFEVDAWFDDVRGKGGFLDIPTNEDIISVGFVRDNLVVYCERSTWQLRYTGKAIAPFQIEKINSELGTESTFSAVQFDTSLVGVGDRGIVDCDSFRSRRIDIKIPDLVFEFNNENNGVKRIQGARDFVNRIAYWTYPYSPQSTTSGDVFPNRRLIYNYENDSWAIYTDSFTALGQFQITTSPTWETLPVEWQDQNWPWVTKLSLRPDVVGGNQQGYISLLDYQVSNDVTLTINDITGSATDPKAPTIFNSVNHNLATGQIVRISGIIGIDTFSVLNGTIGQVNVINKNTFTLSTYNAQSLAFTDPVTSDVGTYLGGGQIAVRDNFNITSKKFNFLDDGQNIQLGFIDVLLNNTSGGAISLNVYLDYNNSQPINILPQNTDNQTNLPDTFFNATVPTYQEGGIQSSKNWHRVFCAVRGAFITLQWTLSNAQMAGQEQQKDVQIESQILWLRRAGRQLPAGV